MLQLTRIFLIGVVSVVAAAQTGGNDQQQSPPPHGQISGGFNPGSVFYGIVISWYTFLIVLSAVMWKVYVEVGKRRKNEVDTSEVSLTEIRPVDFFLPQQHQKGAKFMHELFENSARRLPCEVAVRVAGAFFTRFDGREAGGAGEAQAGGEEYQKRLLSKEELHSHGPENHEHRPERLFEITYGDLNGVANRLAVLLDKHEVFVEHKQRIVAVLLPHSTWLPIAAQIAGLKAHHTVVMLDLEESNAALAQKVSELRPETVLTVDTPTFRERWEGVERILRLQKSESSRDVNLDVQHLISDEVLNVEVESQSAKAGRRRMEESTNLVTNSVSLASTNASSLMSRKGLIHTSFSGIFSSTESGASVDGTRTSRLSSPVDGSQVAFDLADEAASDATSGLLQTEQEQDGPPNTFLPPAVVDILPEVNDFLAQTARMAHDQRLRNMISNGRGENYEAKNHGSRKAKPDCLGAMVLYGSTSSAAVAPLPAFTSHASWVSSVLDYTNYMNLVRSYDNVGLLRDFGCPFSVETMWGAFCAGVPLVLFGADCPRELVELSSKVD